MIQTVNNGSSKGATADDSVSHPSCEQLTVKGMGRWIFAPVDNKFNRKHLIDAGSKVSFPDRTTSVQCNILEIFLIIYAVQILNI